MKIERIRRVIKPIGKPKAVSKQTINEVESLGVPIGRYNPKFQFGNFKGMMAMNVGSWKIDRCVPTECKGRTITVLLNSSELRSKKEIPFVVKHELLEAYYQAIKGMKHTAAHKQVEKMIGEF